MIDERIALWIVCGLFSVATSIVIREYRRGARREQRLAEFVEWAHGVDELLRRIEEDFYTGPADEDPATVESHAVIVGGARVVDPGPPTTSTGVWLESEIERIRRQSAERNGQRPAVTEG